MAPKVSYPGGMIALFPPADIAAQLAITSELPSGATAVPAEELHITLAYFPTDDQQTIDAATAAAARLAGSFGPVQATITGWAELIAGSNGEPHVILFDSGDALDDMQEYLQYCCMACGCQPANDHGFLPHMTVAYTKAGEEAEVGEDYPPTTISFGAVTVKFGDLRHDFMLAGMQNYPTMMMALREKVAALLPNNEDEQVPPGRVSQQTEGDASVDTDTATDKAQWTTGYINDLPDSSFLYVESGGDKDEDGKTTPRSLRHFPVKDADGKVDLPHLRNALARIPQSDAPGLNKDAVTARAQAMLEAAQKEGKRLGSQMLGKISAAISSLGEFMKWAQYDDGEEPPPEEKELSQQFIIRKQDDGSYRWFSFSSNGFEDREGEIVSTKSLEDTVAYGDATGDRGPLRLFHIPGTDIGECDFQAMEGRFLIESGTFGDSDLAKKALAYFLKTDKELGVSIGFLFPEAEFKDNVYGAIRIIERSVLPLGDAANPWTAFQTLKGGAMDDRKQAFLSEVSDEKTAAAIIGHATALTKALEGAVAFKQSAATETPTGEAAKTEEQPDSTFEKALTDAVATAMAPVAEAIKLVADTVATFDDRLKAIESASAEAAAKAVEAATAAEAGKTKAPAGSTMFRATGAAENETPTAIVEKLIGQTEAGVSAQAKAVAPFVLDLIKMGGGPQ